MPKKNKDEQIIDRKGNTNTQQQHEEMLTLTSFQGSANEVRPFSLTIIVRLKV